MNMEKLMADLVVDEGMRLKVYLDTEGIETIGVGRNLRKGITEAEAYYLLRGDTTSAINDANSFEWFEDLSEPRQRAIVNMIFNLGLPRFKGFKKTIRHIKNKEYSRAASEMMNSRWAMQVGPRAHRLAKLMRDG